MRDTGFSPAVKELLWARAQGICEGCGRDLADGQARFSRQHRLARGMGGTRDPAINLPSNGLILCGSATSPGGCHLLCETRNPVAEDSGWWLRRGDPHEIPVRLWSRYGPGRWVRLDDLGGYVDLQEAPSWRADP